jgi:hypothetical protein
LRSSQHGTGGWSLTGGASSNSQSTAWAVQGLVAAGKNPGTFRPKGTNPYDYLKKRQRSDGHYEYSSASDQTPVWVTAQGLAAAYSTEFPMKAVERAPKPPKDQNADTPAPTYNDYSSANNTYTTPSSTGSYDFGSGTGTGSGLNKYLNGGSGGSGNGTSGSGNGTGGQIPGTVPGDGNVLEDEGVAASGAGRERIAAGSGAEQTADSADEPFQAPSTPVLLGGLGGLTALLGAGFLWFSRRLP